MLFLVWLCLLPALFVAGLLFHVRNRAPVQIDLYVAAFDLPASHLVLWSLAVGVVLGWLVGLAGLLGLRHRNRRLARAQRRLETELGALRAGPAAGPGTGDGR